VLNDDDLAIDNLSLTSASQSTSSLSNTATVTTSSISTSSISQSTKKPKPTAMELFLNSIGEDNFQKPTTSSRASIIEELYNYRSLIVQYNSLHKVSTSSCLNFWKTYEAAFPRLSKLAREFVCTPATSVPSESAFSMSAYVARKERARLSIDSLTATVFLKVSYQKQNDLYRKVSEI